MAKIAIISCGANGDRTVPIHASTTTDGVGPCDLVIIATKAVPAFRCRVETLSSDK